MTNIVDIIRDIQTEKIRYEEHLKELVYEKLICETHIQDLTEKMKDFVKKYNEADEDILDVLDKCSAEIGSL